MIGSYLAGSPKSSMISSYYFGLATIMRKVHSFSREIIKPSSPTPHHLKHYNLSSMDQMQFRNYMPHVLFFPSGPGKFGEKSRRLLKHSLSKTLTEYYPFAGRLTSSAYADCNDEGIEFQESRIECTISDILKKYEDDLDLDLVFPPGSVWGTFDNDSSPMIIRVNYFECGGIAIAACLSHLIADACTLSNFINYWAAVTRQSGEHVLPHYVSSPSNDDDFVENPFLQTNKSVTRKRYVFKNTELANLKAKVCSYDGQNPTRVEFLAALFYKCTTAVETAKSGSFRPSILFHPVNMRPKIVPQLPKTAVGNWIWSPNIQARTESELSWNALINQIKNEKKKIEGLKVKDLDGNVLKNRVLESLVMNNYKMYTCSSLCNLDLYKANFGWGNPVRVALGDAHLEDCFTFSDTPSGDGIEVLISFQEQEMVKIQLDKELDALASLN